jgi:hypothetical protein
MDFIISFIQAWNNPSGAAVGVAETPLIVVADGHTIIMFIGMNEQKFLVVGALSEIALPT